MGKGNILYQTLDGVTPEGPFIAVGTPDGTKAAVVVTHNGKEPDEKYTVHRYKGDTSWADAVNQASNLNARRKK